MNCPYCNSELVEHDFFGNYVPGIGFVKRNGTIYICPIGRNSEPGCEYDGHFYDMNDDILREGIPC